MEEFPGLLARDYGLRPQGKSAPMSSFKASGGGGGSGGPSLGAGLGRSSGSSSSRNRSRSGWNTGDSFLGGGISEDRSPPGYGDVYGGPPRYSNPTSVSSSSPSIDVILEGLESASLPVYDKPVYDEDIFDGVPGTKNSSSVEYVDVFGGISSLPNHASSPPYADLLENLGRTMPEPKRSDNRSGEQKAQDFSGFDELIPGFGGSSPPQQREPPETKQQSAAPSDKSTAGMPVDPFVVLETNATSAYSPSGFFTDPLEHINRPMNSGSTEVDASPASGGRFDDNTFDELKKSVPLFTSEINDNLKDKSPLTSEKEPPHRSSKESSENIIPKMQPTKSSDSLKPVGRSSVQNSDANFNTYERNDMADQSPRSYDHLETSDDVWLTVSEIPLFTQSTSAPPPSRVPPPVAIKQAPFGRTDQSSSVGLNVKKKDNESFLQSTQSYLHMKNSVKKSGVSPIDELEAFVMGKPQRYANEHAEEEEIETNLAAAAMKEAMDRAEAKFKHAREVRERERDARSAKSREYAQQEKDEKAMSDGQDPEDKEKQERLDREREQREREEKEKEQKRREKEREQELERERGRARQTVEREAVERATREARERSAAESRLRAERLAVEKANAEARQRAERAAVQRAASEARERAAAEAREKAEKAAAEARERAAAEAREKVTAEARAAAAREKAAAEAKEKAAVDRAVAEARIRSGRAAVDRATAEARERALAEARERATREKQNKPENDIESFFRMGTRPNSVPKQRETPETGFDAQFQTRGVSDGTRRTSSGPSTTIRKNFSTTNIVEDLTSIFGAPPSSGDFQEVEGESEERRRARVERHQRTLERAAKALAEKNERDMQAQRDQAERHRIAETLDIEIKRWAAGKEGNLRALLSTLQYVLWPECGWQPVSLTDLITGASVKKVYRKATLCIHPDKVQQKGASLHQKYIAEKVFDLLKEAWNKFNSEELF